MNDNNSSGNGLVPQLMGWIQHPFNASGSALNWILFVGLLVIAAFMWQLVLLRLTNDV